MSSMPLVTVALARAMSVSYCGCVLGMDWGEHDACQRVGLLEEYLYSTGHHEGLLEGSTRSARGRTGLGPGHVLPT
jgi:hypothetical protein